MMFSMSNIEYFQLTMLYFFVILFSIRMVRTTLLVNILDTVVIYDQNAKKIMIKGFARVKCKMALIAFFK